MDRPPEIEPLSNLFFVHRLSGRLLPFAIRLHIHPNMVTLAGLGFGMLAAASYTHWQETPFVLLGFLLMAAWHVADGLDGALARATGKSSPLGRLLDGVADYSTFVLVNLAIVATLPHPGLMLVVAVFSGAAHILQSLFYEGVRETYIRRGRGEFTATARSVAGGAVERLYNYGEAFLSNHATTFDRMLLQQPEDERQALVRRWQRIAAPRIRAITALSANGRTLAIFFACLAGHPWAYWVWEIIGLTFLAMAGQHWLRLSEEEALKACNKPA